ncbi:MAG: hypothetical protein ACRC68_17700 [Clostridium sp.]
MSKNNIHEIVATSDSGNYSIKTIIDGKYENFTNVYVPASLAEVKEILENEKNYGRVDEDMFNSLYVAVKLDGEKEATEFMFEDRAKALSECIYRPNVEKSGDKQLIMNTILSVAVTYLNNMEASEYEEEINIKVKLNTGLPVNEWRRAESQETYKNLFMGKHSIEFLDRYYREELGIKKVNIEVEDVHIQVEGIAALKLVTNTNEIPKDMFYKFIDKIIITLDIGQHTTDIAGASYYYNERKQTLTIQEMAKFGFGIDKGIGDVEVDIIKEIYNSNLVDGRAKITPANILTAVTTNNFLLPGYGVDIKEIYTKHMKQFTVSLAEQFVKACDEAGNRQKICLILLSGGGSNEVQIVEAFKEFISSKNYDDSIVDVMNEYCDPIYANALGYSVMSKFNSK